MNKIYCEDCKYCRHECGEGYYNSPYCKNKNNFKNIPHAVYKKYGVEPPCETVNSNNDCKYYEPKKIIKLINYLKGVRHEISK